MFKFILQHLGGVEQYGVASLCLFCAIFTGVLIWAFMQRKSYLDYMSRVALDPEPTQDGKETHE